MTQSMHLVFVAIFTLTSFAASAGAPPENVVDCKAVNISGSPFQQAFSVEEYPEVTVTAYDVSHPMLPAIMMEYEVSIGANTPYKAKEDGVKSIRNESENGVKKFVVTMDDGSTVTVEVDGYSGTVTSSDGSIEADLSCE